MKPHRIHVKYFVKDLAAVDLLEFVPIFQRWIQNHTVEGLLIDVVDYRHVYEGPGIVLIGHEADYAMDISGGQPGLLYRRKRQLSGDLREQLRTALRLALRGCHALETDPDLAGRISFHTGRVELAFVDRLRAPNRPETFDALHQDIQAVLDELYADVSVILTPLSDDVRRFFVVRVDARGAADLATLLGRLDSGAISDHVATPAASRV